MDRKISYTDIQSVTVKTGSHLKRPGLILIFGFGLLLFTVWVLLGVGFSLFYFFDTGLFFVSSIGIYAVLQGLPIHTVIQIRCSDKTECFSLSPLIKRKQFSEFRSFLEHELGKEKVIRDPRFESERK